MNKKAYFFIDDTIWAFRDIARQKPASIFDQPFLALMKEAHDKYGMKVQLNLFYQTDFFYGHSFRLLQNRKPETALFTRVSLNAAITRSICGYNHLTPDLVEPTYYTCKAHYDEATGMHFKRMCNGPVLNLSTLDGLSEEFAPITDKEFVGYATHEQYFYPEYFLYQTDYADKIEKAAKIIYENGYEYVFIEDLV